jgi:opacity protein-like surface antigen
MALLLGMTFNLITAGVCGAEDSGQWCAQVHWGMAAPIGSLQNWFAPSARLVGIEARKWLNRGWSWRAGVEFLEFAQENTSRLYYRDLDLSFSSTSATVRGSYALASWQGVHSFVGGGVGLHHWRSRRGAYQLEEVLVPARQQEEWSWAFEGSLGARMDVVWRFGLVVEMGYRLIVGELWPALALRLENVSGLQSLFCTLGLQIAF